MLGLSVLIGLFRGLVFELMSLAGWIVAYKLASSLYLHAGLPVLATGGQGVSALLDMHARVDDGVEVNRSAADSNGHQRSWGKRSAMRRG